MVSVCSGLLALSPCGRSFSWDRYRALAQARDARDIPPEYGDLWPQRLIALQLAALYFWAAVDKTNWSFLSGERLEQAFTWSYTGRALEPLISLGAILPVFDAIFHPVAERLARRCDAVLRIGGASSGADAMAKIFRDAGRPVYRSLAEVPAA